MLLLAACLLFTANPALPSVARADDAALSSASPRVEKSLAGLSAEVILGEAAVPPSEETEIHILLRFRAPEDSRSPERPPLSLALVIDRSGSMADAKKLDYAIRAGKEAVRLLGPKDSLALIQYDDKVQVLFPLAPLKDKSVLNRLLDGLTPGETTFLSGGLEAGIAQLRKDRSGNLKRVLLLSDGLANRGVTDAGRVAAMGASARDKGISVSSMGLGLDYDETLMQGLAQRGGGQYSYIRDSEDLPAFFRQELALASASVTRGFRLIFIPDFALSEIKSYGYVATPADVGLAVEMGDFYAGEERQVLLKVKVRPGAGPVQALGAVRLEFALAEGSPAQTLELPLAVAVVPDEAERKAQNSAAEAVTGPVQEEALLLAAKEAQVLAAEELQKGDLDKARTVLRQAAASLAQAAPHSPKAANAMASLAEDEEKAEEAVSNPRLQQEMAKSSKYSLYKSSQGKDQTLLLQPGDKGALVEKLQRRLAEKGLYSGPVDGVYSEDLARAVQTFQSGNGLDADGIAGRLTQRALGM
ncbi:MAG: VWA domain-containing protein [Deltaproteobacteria bacterium]|jgi:Ca-activated chloride channel family protein|nr:VWA domain-containing protein [Deltaproteobacteria bacterium]